MKIKKSIYKRNQHLILIALILTLFFSTGINATNYYVSANGDDGADGLTPSTAWQSLDKVNSIFSTIPAGSSIYFHRGDTFYGTINIAKSGTSGASIRISAYGTGNKPVITGFVTIPSSSWVAEPEFPGVYSTTSIITTSILTNMVTIDGKQVGMGRYPDKSFLTYESTNGTNTITDTGLGSTINWKGAGMAIRKNDWTLDRVSISNHVGDVLTFSNLGTTQSPTAGFGYFFMNDLRTLTTYGEWYHKPATKKFYMYFGSVDPLTKVVQVANITDLIYNSGGYDYITIDSLNFTGAINNAVNLTASCDNVIVQNCDISFCGDNGIFLGSGKDRLIDNNTISYCNSIGIFDNYGSTATITNNLISDIGIIPGQSYYVNGNNGIYMPGNGGIISHNIIKRTGYDGICVKYSGAATISCNYIDSVCMVLNDGGGIYVCGSNLDTRLIDHNIITNVFGNGAGAIRQTSLAEGIYLDEYSSNMIVTNNSVSNCGNSGIKLHQAHDNQIYDNTTYNCGLGLGFLNSTGTSVNWNNKIERNIFLAKTTSQYALNFASVNDLMYFGVSNNNYYARPADDNKSIAITINGSWSTNTLASWQTISGQDKNSQKSPVKITSYNDIRFEHNPTMDSKTITLDGTYITVDKKIYNGIVTLEPYSSIILMRYTNTDLPTQISNSEQLKVMPNIIWNQINIEMNDDECHGFQIINSTGQIVYAGKLNRKTTVESSKFAPGIYFVKLDIGKSCEIKKIMKI